MYLRTIVRFICRERLSRRDGVRCICARRNRIPVPDVSAFNCEDEAVLQLFLSEARSSAKVILGQFSDSDLLIHHCGPSSLKRRSVTGEIDRRLREIAACYGDDVTWVIIGDHGMTDVIEEVDVAGEVAMLEKKAGVRHGQDYLLFLDSTMARFRCLTDKGGAFVSNIAAAKIFEHKGTFIDRAMAERYSIPVGDRRYGDAIWWANLGTLIFRLSMTVTLIIRECMVTIPNTTT